MHVQTKAVKLVNDILRAINRGSERCEVLPVQMVWMLVRDERGGHRAAVQRGLVRDFLSEVDRD